MKIYIAILFALFSSCGGHVLSKQEIQKYQSSQRKCEDAVTFWIKNQALYPDSYQSLGFKEYREASEYQGSKKISGSESYYIWHSHTLKDVKGELKTFSGYFLLENDFFINTISTEKLTLVGPSFPPRTELWISQFGRARNASDSSVLEIRQKKMFGKILNDLNQSINNGDARFEKEWDEQKWKNMLDSLDKPKPH